MSGRNYQGLVISFLKNLQVYVFVFSKHLYSTYSSHYSKHFATINSFNIWLFRVNVRVTMLWAFFQWRPLGSTLWTFSEGLWAILVAFTGERQVIRQNAERGSEP